MRVRNAKLLKTLVFQKTVMQYKRHGMYLYGDSEECQSTNKRISAYVSVSVFGHRLEKPAKSK
jgi:hypothetical protein